jgi:hypothetical protein
MRIATACLACLIASPAWAQQDWAPKAADVVKVRIQFHLAGTVADNCAFMLLDAIDFGSVPYADMIGEFSKSFDVASAMKRVEDAAATWPDSRVRDDVKRAAAGVLNQWKVVDAAVAAIKSDKPFKALVLIAETAKDKAFYDSLNRITEMEVADWDEQLDRASVSLDRERQIVHQSACATLAKEREAAHKKWSDAMEAECQKLVNGDQELADKLSEWLGKHPGKRGTPRPCKFTAAFVKASCPTPAARVVVVDRRDVAGKKRCDCLK